MKIKGCRTERELLHKFYDEGWQACRVAGSGSTPLPAPDLIAGKDGRILVIECKAGKGDKKYIETEQIDELNKLATKMGAEAWIGLRFDREDWYFIQPKNLNKTKGGNIVISLDFIKQKGRTLKGLIKCRQN